MRNRQLWIVAATSVAVLLLAAVLAFSQTRLAPPVVQAQTQATTPELPRTITVVGEGKVRIKPDIAQATIGVEVMKPTVKEASSGARDVMKAVLKVLKEQGIAEKDIQTSNFSVWAERPSYGSEGPSSEEVLYHVSNQVMVAIRDLETVETVLGATMEAGANNIYGVTFSLADPSQVESEARKKAVDDAKAKAQELAVLNGLKLGDVVSVSEVIGERGGYYAGGFREVAVSAGMGGGGGPISPGELELTLQLQIVYTVQ